MSLSSYGSFLSDPDFRTPGHYDLTSARTGDSRLYATSQTFDAASGDFIEAIFTSHASLVLRSLDVAQVNTPVPEPGAWALMILGFGGVGLAARARIRRRMAL